MTDAANTDGLIPQDGGLLLRVDHYDKHNPSHDRHAMSDTINTVSLAHGAASNKNGLLRNLRLLNASDEDDPEIILEFFRAKWDVCEAKSKDGTASSKLNANDQDGVLIGAATGWLTHYYDEKGRLRRSHHLEDFAVFKNGIRALFPKPDGFEFPHESLAGCFDRISLEKMHKKYGVVYRFGEVAPDNIAMMRQMDNNGANMGGAVLEFDRMPGGLFDPFPETVKVRPIWIKGKKSKRSFIVRWKDGDHDIRFVVTKGQATASGVPRIDIRPWDNGNPPDPRILQGIVAATLRAIEEEVGEKKRNWGLQKSRYVPSPIIPLLASRRNKYKALFNASAERVVIPNADVSNTFDATNLPIHVHIIGQPRMIEAFKAVQAQTRFFGEKPTVPGVNIVEAAIRAMGLEPPRPSDVRSDNDNDGQALNAA